LKSSSPFNKDYKISKTKIKEVTMGIEKHQCKPKNESLQFSTTQGNARNFENGEQLQRECRELSKGM
jgi:hypothetical protein